MAGVNLATSTGQCSGAGMISAILAAMAQTAVASDAGQASSREGQGGTTQSPLVALSVSEAGEGCLPDQSICLRVVQESGNEGAVLEVRAGGSNAQVRSVPLEAVTTSDGSAVSLWPTMIRIDSEDPMIAGRRHTDWVVGIIEEQRSMYSGGGASAQRLSLYLLPTGSSGVLGQDILTVPIKAYAMIRACFTENDFERRRGACHDEYTFDGSITLAPRRQARGQQNGMPDLRFSTVATAYPYTSRRNLDNVADDRPTLRQSDLRKWRDPVCSYTRTLRYNVATLRYEMDRLAPECSDYTTP